MHPQVLRHLRCSVCGLALTDGATDGVGGALRCPRGHSFDRARQGYVDLTAGRRPHAGDTAQMVAAREEFLAAGYYDPISALLATAARDATGEPSAATPGPRFVIDAGAGTAWHLAAVLDALPGAVGLALDVSKPALRRAARAHPRAVAALADTWGALPVAPGSADLVLNVFAPRNAAEFHRVLRPDGALLVVTPTAGHLGELVNRLELLRVDPDKAERVDAGLAGHFTAYAESSTRHTLLLDHRQVGNLVAMGPSAWHTDPDRLARRIAALPDPMPVTLSVRLASYRPR